MVYLIASLSCKSRPLCTKRPRRTWPRRLEPLEQRVLVTLSGTIGSGSLPLAFEPNVGQAQEIAEFLARGDGYTLLLIASEAVLAPSPSENANSPHLSECRRKSQVAMLAPKGPAPSGCSATATTYSATIRRGGTPTSRASKASFTTTSIPALIGLFC